MKTTRATPVLALLALGFGVGAQSADPSLFAGRTWETWGIGTLRSAGLSR